MLAGQKLQAFTSAYADRETADVTSITVTTPANGTTVCGVAFVAPQSGTVLVAIHGDLDQTSGSVVLGWRVRTGGTPGSGTIVDGPEAGDGVNAEIGRIVAEANRVSAGNFAIVSGLTPADTYNAATFHYIFGGGSGTVFSRAIAVIPLL